MGYCIGGSFNIHIWRGSAISSAHEEKSGSIYLGCLNCADVRAFHENTDRIFNTKSRMLLSPAGIFDASLTNGVDPDQTGSTLFSSKLMLTNKQAFSDVVILLAF